VHYLPRALVFRSQLSARGTSAAGFNTQPSNCTGLSSQRTSLGLKGILGISVTPGLISTPCFHGSPGLRAHLRIRNSPDQVRMWRLAYSMERERVVHKWCMGPGGDSIGSPDRSLPRPDQRHFSGWRRWDSNPRPPACKYARPGRWRTPTDGYGWSGSASGRSRTVANGGGWYMNGPSPLSGRPSSGL
jgi:hypothetical protein